MHRLRVISRIDIKNEFVVKGIQMEGVRKLGNPNDYARCYYRDGIDEILFVDVVASHYNRNSLTTIIDNSCKEVFIPIVVCGGIKTVEDALLMLKNGADKIAVNTAAIAKPEIITHLADKVGSQSIVASIEAKKNENNGGWVAYYNNGRESSMMNAVDWAYQLEKLGAGEILLTSVDKDGTQRGFDVSLIRAVRSVVKIPLIVSGGCGQLSHLDFLEDCRVDGVAIASAFHYSLFSIEVIKNYLESLGYLIRKCQ